MFSFKSSVEGPKPFCRLRTFELHLSVPAVSLESGKKSAKKSRNSASQHKHTNRREVRDITFDIKNIFPPMLPLCVAP